MKHLPLEMTDLFPGAVGNVREGKVQGVRRLVRESLYFRSALYALGREEVRGVLTFLEGAGEPRVRIEPLDGLPSLSPPGLVVVGEHDERAALTTKVQEIFQLLLRGRRTAEPHGRDAHRGKRQLVEDAFDQDVLHCPWVLRRKERLASEREILRAWVQVFGGATVHLTGNDAVHPARTPVRDADVPVWLDAQEEPLSEVGTEPASLEVIPCRSPVIGVEQARVIGFGGLGGGLLLPPPLLVARLRCGVRLRQGQAELPSKIMRGF